MRASKIAYVAVAVAVLLMVVVGVAISRGRAGNKKEVQAPRAADATAALAEIFPDKAKPAPKVSPAEAAISAAAQKNRYVFVTFYRGNDGASKKMQAAIQSARGRLSHRASFVSIDVDDPVEQEVVAGYGADRSPMPLTLAVAPNGAVTAGFPNKIEQANFSEAFVSNGTAAVLKVLQDQKLAAVCVQGPRTKNNKKCLATAEELKADPALGGAVEIVKIDPSNRSEAKFMKMCRVDVRSTDAQLLVLAPPGRMVGKFDGAATKDTVMASLQSSLGGGCGGGSCGPSGCGP